MHRQSGDCRCLCDVRKSMEEKDQKYLRRLEEKLEENYPQQKETLQSIVAIESVVSPQDGSAPFGKEADSILQLFFFLYKTEYISKSG